MTLRIEQTHAFPMSEETCGAVLGGVESRLPGNPNWKFYGESADISEGGYQRRCCQGNRGCVRGVAEGAARERVHRYFCALADGPDRRLSPDGWSAADWGGDRIDEGQDRAVRTIVVGRRRAAIQRCRRAGDSVGPREGGRIVLLLRLGRPADRCGRSTHWRVRSGRRKCGRAVRLDRKSVV